MRTAEILRFNTLDDTLHLRDTQDMVHQEKRSRTIPIALLVDDGAPVNPMFFHDPPYAHDLLMPQRDITWYFPHSVTVLTHWQSLYSDGTCAGWWGLERLLGRLQKQHGNDLAWSTCSELAKRVTGSGTT